MTHESSQVGCRRIRVAGWKPAAWKGLILLAVGALFSCERPTVDEVESVPVVGYQISGRIVDRFGVPMEGVDIYPYYDLTYVSSDTAPTREYTIRDSVTFVSMMVLDARDSVVRSLGEGLYAPGNILATWDRKDDGGGDVPSGVYRVCYRVGGEIAAAYAVLVEGTLTARSDASGAFTLWDYELPMGFSPVPLYSRDSTMYYGLYAITDVVVLDLVTPSRVHSIAVRPVKDRVTTVPLVLE